ncbi:MAG: LptF/LptG family permease [Pseudomonadota bacterium]
MIGFGRIERYIFRECTATLLIVLLVIMSAVVVVDLIEQLRTVGTRTDLGIVGALYLSSLKLPDLIEQTLPFAILISTMLTFRRLSRNAELPVIRASGVSAWRFLIPPAFLAVIVGVLATTSLSPLGARAKEAFETQRAELLNRQNPDLTVFETGIWLRLGDDVSEMVIQAAEVDETGTSFSDVKFIEQERDFEQDSEPMVFRRRIDAKSARLRDGFWQLEELTENVPGEPPREFDTLALPTDLAQDALINRFAAPQTIDFWHLREHIEQTRDAGLNVSRYLVRWHSLLAAPALFVAMALIGALACLRLARLGGTAQLVAVATLGALGLFLANRLASGLGSIGFAPPIVVAWTPPLFAIFACLAIVAYREDG